VNVSHFHAMVSTCSIGRLELLSTLMERQDGRRQLETSKCIEDLWRSPAAAGLRGGSYSTQLRFQETSRS
jgi:hypothetical protein